MTTSDVGSARIDTPYMQGRPRGGSSPCRGSHGGGRGLGRDRLGAPARRMRAALGKFFLGVRGAAAIETALSVSALVVALAVLMQVVNTVFVDDQAERAARAAARALALDPSTNPWGPVWEELHSNASHPCTTDWTTADLGDCGNWTLAVIDDASPAALAAALGPNPPASAPASGGDLVLVGLSRSAASIPGVQSANASPGPNPGASRTVADLVGMDAIGVARREPEA